MDLHGHFVNVHLFLCTCVGFHLLVYMHNYRERLQQCLRRIIGLGKFILELSWLRSVDNTGAKNDIACLTGLTIPPLLTRLHAFCIDGYPCRRWSSLVITRCKYTVWLLFTVETTL